MSVGKKLMDEIIDLAGEGSAIARKARALSESDLTAIGEILADSMVNNAFGLAARRSVLLNRIEEFSKGATIEAAYARDHAARQTLQTSAPP